MRRAGKVYFTENISTLPVSILKITIVFWLCAKFISFQAWVAEGRLFPIIPAFDAFTVQPVVHQTLFWISVTAMGLLLFFARIKALTIILIISEIASCLLDVARWQPWEFQYLFIIFIFSYSLYKPKVFYNAVAFMLATIYIFSGLHKLNGGFLYTIWENMMLRSFAGVSSKQIVFLQLHYIGLILPVIEIIAGFALLLMKNKKWPSFVLIAMHLFNLVFLGPYGLNYNIIVWPWNVAMIAYLYLMFIYNRQQFLFSFMFAGRNRLVLIFFGLLPILSFWGYWDSHFSSNLYSGKTKNLAICVEEKAVPQLRPYFSKDTHHICTNTSMLKVQKWAFEGVGLPPYPEEWYYRRFVQQWKKEHPGVEAKFFIYQYPFKGNIEIR
jgi:hypothetical protein